MWIEIHQSLRSKGKLLDLADALDLPEYAAIGVMTSFWLWAVDESPDGIMPYNAKRIARAIHFDGDPDVLVKAMIDAGFLIQDEGNLFIHNWEKYTGRIMQMKARNAEKQQRYRDTHPKKPADELPLSPRNRNVPVTLPENTAQQDLTGPNITEAISGIETGDGKPQSQAGYQKDEDYIAETLAKRPDLKSWLDEKVARANPAKLLPFQAVSLRGRLRDEAEGRIPPPVAPPPLPDWTDAKAVTDWLSEVSFCGYPSRSQVLRGESLLLRQGKGINTIGTKTLNAVAGWQCDQDDQWYIPSTEGYNARPVPFVPGVDVLPDYVLPMIGVTDPAKIVRCVK